MAAKKRKGKKKKKNAEIEPDDDYMKMDGETLEQTRARNKDKLAEAKIKRNMLQMEKDMVQDFYHNTRAEIRELEARVKNLDTDMQSLEEKQRTQIKVFMQKVRHLEYEHDNNIDKVKGEAEGVLKEERSHHIKNQKDMLIEKKKEKDDYDGVETQNRGDIDSKNDELKVSLDDT